MPHRLITPPANSPITVDEVKDQSHIDTDADNGQVQLLINRATTHVENRAKIAVMPQTWLLTMDSFTDRRHCFDGEIRIGRPPFGQVTQFDYVDDAGRQQQLVAANYQVEISRVVRIIPAYLTDWPTTRHQLNAVQITHTAGYADADSVPDDIKAAIVILCDEMYNHRGDVSESTERTVWNLIKHFNVEAA